MSRKWHQSKCRSHVVYCYNTTCLFCTVYPQCTVRQTTQQIVQDRQADQSMPTIYNRIVSDKNNGGTYNWSIIATSKFDLTLLNLLAPIRNRTAFMMKCIATLTSIRNQVNKPIQRLTPSHNLPSLRRETEVTGYDHKYRSRSYSFVERQKMCWFD